MPLRLAVRARWVYAINHKDIGTMYLVLAGLIWFVGGTLAMLIRAPTEAAVSRPAVLSCGGAARRLDPE